VVQDLPSDLFIMFSTAPGNKAEDGVRGKRNSPFAEAFLKYIKSTEPLTIMAAHVTNETLFLTEQRQRPFYRGSIISDVYYSLNPAIKTPEPIAQVTPVPLPLPQPAPAPKPTPSPQPAQPEPARPPQEKRDIDPAAYRLNSLGVSVGTTFAAPMFAGTVQGTLAPWRSSFFQLGMDIGLGSGKADIGHFSLYPFVHYAFFIPFTKGGGWYAGAGAGLMIASYTFPEEGKITGNTFAADATTGFILGSGITISYTLRSDFSSASNKLAVGYSYRF
jgi:hypothetical protein